MKKIIFTDKAPAPIGPYNQAVLKGDTLYASGQIAIKPQGVSIRHDRSRN
jgi:2-iminobutanoate/2-iminopropanoate deaminase